MKTSHSYWPIKIDLSSKPFQAYYLPYWWLLSADCCLIHYLLYVQMDGWVHTELTMQIHIDIVHLQFNFNLLENNGCVLFILVTPLVPCTRFHTQQVWMWFQGSLPILDVFLYPAPACTYLYWVLYPLITVNPTKDANWSQYSLK